MDEKLEPRFRVVPKAKSGVPERGRLVITRFSFYHNSTSARRQEIIYFIQWIFLRYRRALQESSRSQGLENKHAAALVT